MAGLLSIPALPALYCQVSCSMLRDADDKARLGEWLDGIQPGLALQPRLGEATTHLVMSTISLSIKVVTCLARGIPIVTPVYFRDYLACIRSSQALPQVCLTCEGLLVLMLACR